VEKLGHKTGLRATEKRERGRTTSEAIPEGLSVTFSGKKRKEK